MELFIRRRWTTKPAQSVSYSVFEGKHFLFQLRVFYFLSWITTGPVLVHLLLKFSMAYPILSMKAAISKIKLYSLLFGKISHHTQRGQTIHFESALEWDLPKSSRRFYLFSLSSIWAKWYYNFSSHKDDSNNIFPK